MDDLTMLIESAKGRAAFYEYFSVVFRSPPNKTFAGSSAKFLPYFDAYAEDTENELMKTGAAQLKVYAEREAATEADAMLDELNKQYTSLFSLGAGSIPSNESAFTTPSRLIKQEPWERVTAFYHIRKFALPKSFKEPEDHISAELLFMRQMCELCAKMAEGKYGVIEEVFKEQKQFMDEHLLRWAPAFCSMIAQRNIKPGITLYRAAANLLRGFLEEEKKILDFSGVKF